MRVPSDPVANFHNNIDLRKERDSEVQVQGKEVLSTVHMFSYTRPHVYPINILNCIYTFEHLFMKLFCILWG